MRITLLCSDASHPIRDRLDQWVESNRAAHEIALVHARDHLPGGDILFLISCTEIIKASDRSRYHASLVLHASDLPQGRGWSPHIWQIISGARQITLSLIEAEDKVDSGRIWHQARLSIPSHALWNEINSLLFDAEIELINQAVREINTVTPREQDSSVCPTYYSRRTPDDSRIDPSSSISSQFDLMRVCDPERFPAFFELHGHKYKISLEKLND